MASRRVERFIAALRTLEQTGDPSPLVALFGEGSSLRNAMLERDLRGRVGAERFWRAYHAAFHHVDSVFLSVVEDGDRASLEWRTHGELSDGSPFHYGGVTLLEFDGDRIARFSSYFDPAALTVHAPLEGAPTY